MAVPWSVSADALAAALTTAHGPDRTAAAELRDAPWCYQAALVDEARALVAYLAVA